MPDWNFVLSIAAVIISLLMSLLAWSLKEQIKNYVKHDECQHCRSACADVRAGAMSGIVRVEARLENMERQQNDQMRKIDQLLSKFDALPDRYVTLDRFKDFMQNIKE